MPRIPQSEIDHIKSTIPVQKLAEAHGIVLRMHGGNLLGLCPFHDDKNPSLVITPEKNLWHCLGACQAGGSVIDWVMKIEGVSFRHAVELLRAGYTGAAGGAVPEKKSGGRFLAPPVAAGMDDAQALGQVADYYHETLKKTPVALQYLQKRGIDHPEVLARFRLGFADRTLGLHLPHRQVKAGAELRGRLQDLGVMRESGHEHFNGSIVFPLFGNAGEITGMYGRKINDNLRNGTPVHLYLPGAHRGLFNPEGITACDGELILCEAIIDALTFWCAGFRNVTAAYGVEGFTADHWAALRAAQVKTVFIAYDRDEAGDAAAAKIAKDLISAGISVYRVLFPHGMDANEYAQKVKPADKSLGLILRGAEWIGNGDTEKGVAMEHRDHPIAKATPPGAPSACSAVDSKTPEKTEETKENPKPDPVPEAPPPAAVFLGAPPLGAPPLGAPSACSVLDSTQREQDAPATLGTPSACSVLRQSKPSQTLEKRGDDLFLTLGDREYRIRGLAKNQSFEVLRVNLRLMVGDLFHVDTLDLYQAKARAVFVNSASEATKQTTETIGKDFAKLLLLLEEMLAKQISETLKPKTVEVPVLSEADQAAALAWLKAPNLLDRILADFATCGVVGEEINKLAGYLAAVSRKLDEPLAILIQSSSAAGKSSLMEAILALIPPEERMQYSAMTGQSLYYMGNMDLAHKVLAIAEEEGASKASYALKLLQSEGVLTIASTGKDPKTGLLETQNYEVKGPVMIFMTTTAVEIDEELMNRCVVLTVDEGTAQTHAIHQVQRARQTLAGQLTKRDREGIRKIHQDAQRLLQPLMVVNPYAERLTFLSHRTRLRRDHVKYLTLIRTVALLHQHQRPVLMAEHNGQNIPYIEVIPEDIRVANKIAHVVLGRSLDELSPPTRKFLVELHGLVSRLAKEKSQEISSIRLSRREIREATGWTNTQVHVHLMRLVELEYVIQYQGARGMQNLYELAYDGEGQDGSTFLPGLVDPETLKTNTYDATLSVQKPTLSDPIRSGFGMNSVGIRSDFSEEPPIKNQEEVSKDYNFDKKRTSGCENSDSNRSHNHRQRSGQESDDGTGPDDGQQFPSPVEG